VLFIPEEKRPELSSRTRQEQRNISRRKSLQTFILKVRKDSAKLTFPLLSTRNGICPAALHRSGVEVEFLKISKSPLHTKNDKQIALPLKWSFEKSPNLHSIVEIKNKSFCR
jgi:hypothetical protein